MFTCRIIRWIAALALAAANCMVSAQEFPTGPITLVAPFPAGSVTDTHPSTDESMPVQLESLLHDSRFRSNSHT